VCSGRAVPGAPRVQSPPIRWGSTEECERSRDTQKEKEREREREREIEREREGERGREREREKERDRAVGKGVFWTRRPGHPA
jgi:hypothetical protein